MRLALFAVSVVAAVAGYQASGHPLVKRNVDSLQSAQSLKATLSVAEVGGVAEEQTLTLSKPNLLRLESPASILIADGTTIFRVDKSRKTYTETPQADGWNALLREDLPWIWAGFFDADFAKTFGNPSTGGNRKVRNVAVTEVKGDGPGKKPFTLYFDEKLGAFRGGSYGAQRPGGVITFLVASLEIALGKEKLEGGFTFEKAAYAKEAEAGAPNPNGLKYADVKDILDRRCAGCHGGANPTRNIDLTSYERIMGGRSPLVVAGNPDNSRLIRIIRSGKMPPGGGMPSEETDKLAQWIKDGAQK